MAKLLDGTRIYGSANIDNNLIVNTMNIVPTIIASFNKANQQTNLAFTTVLANGISLVADSNADTLTILTSGNVSITADAAGDNMTFDLTTTGVTAATYGSATIVPVLTVDSRGRLTTVANATIDTSIATAAFTKANAQANLAFSTVVANGTSLVADSNADTLTILTSGNVSIIGNATGDNMTFDLTTTGVTAATYGSATIVPVFTVDSRGRLTSVSNVAISGSGGSSNSFSTVSANGTSLVATSSADTLTIGTTGNVSITADAAGDNMTFDLTTTGVTAATYGSATIVPVLTVDSRGRLTSVSNVAISGSGGSSNSFSTVVANGTSLIADSNADTLTILTTGNVSIIADSAGDNLTFDLTTTGVTAATYGSTTIVPVLTVDSRGRLTTVANATIDTSIATAAFAKANAQANLAFSTVIANGTSLVADSNADTLTILTSGNVSIIGNATGDNMTFDLTTTGVTAATYGSNTIVPVLSVDSRGRITSVTNTTISTTIASAAFDKANSANLAAVGSFTKANGAAQLSFSTVIANGTSLVADSNADTLTILTSGNVSITADAAGDNMTFDLTTTGVTAATYGSTTIVPVLTVDSRGRLTSVTNTSISTAAASAAFDKANGQANLAFSTIIANGTSLVADSNADTLTILTSGNVSITADSGGDNLTFDLTTTGVTAGVYGNSTIVPVISVDSRGRVTTISNVAITSGGGGGTSTNSIVFISDTAPANVANGTLWWNSDDGSLYIRYADSNSTQWVVTSSGGDGGGGSSGGGVTTGKAIAMAIVFGG